MDNELLEPLSAYEKVYKAKFLHNAIKYFDELTEKGKVDSELNKQTIEKIKKADEDISSLQKNLNKKNILMVFLYIMLVVFLIFTLFCWAAYLYTLIVVPILCSIFFIGYLVSMILIKKMIVDKKIDNLENELREKIVSKEMLIQDAKEQMSGLNSLYDWNTTSKIICDTIDLVFELEYVLPFPSNFPVYHDGWLGSMVELKGRVLFLPTNCILYRRHNSNLSFSATKSGISFKRRIINRVMWLYLTMRRYLFGK